MVELLKSHDQEITLDNLFEIRKQSALKKLRNLKLNQGRWSWRFWIWLKRVGLTEADIKVLEDTELNEQRTEKRDKDLWGCLLARKTFWKRRRESLLVILQCVISWIRFQGLILRHAIVRLSTRRVKWPTYSLQGNASSVCCLLLLIFIIFNKNECYLFSLVKKYCL
jgi:hypothetical protein